jgi:hypothetical protein
MAEKSMIWMQKVYFTIIREKHYLQLFICTKFDYNLKF